MYESETLPKFWSALVHSSSRARFCALPDLVHASSVGVRWLEQTAPIQSLIVNVGRYDNLRTGVNYLVDASYDKGRGMCGC